MLRLLFSFLLFFLQPVTFYKHWADKVAPARANFLGINKEDLSHAEWLFGALHLAFLGIRLAL
jgi:hypothetical protein